MISLETLTVALTADTGKYSKALDQSEKKTRGWGSRMGGLAKGVGLAAAGGVAAAGAAMGTLAVKGDQAFREFESQMGEVFTLLPGISESAMDEMSGQVQQFSRDFGVLPDEVVPALYQSLSAGIPQGNVFEFMETAQMAAKGGVTELSTAVDGISSVVNAYGEDVIGAGEASDLMFTAVKEGKTNFEELSASLFNVIPTAASAGVGFEDITAAMASLTSQGTPTSVATTQMRQLLVELTKDGGKAADAFEQIAGKSFVDFVEEGGNVQGALEIMEQAAEDNEVRLSDMFGSVEAGNAALGLTGKGAAGFAENLEEMENASGATEKAFEQMEDTGDASIEKLQATWATAMISIGEKLAPAREALIGFAVDKIPVLVDAFEDILDVVGRVMSFVEDTIGEAVSFVQDNFGDFHSAIDTDAIGPLNFFKDWIDENLPKVQQIIENILGGIQTFWNLFGDDILFITDTVFGNVFDVADTMMRNTLDVISILLDLMTGDFDSAGETLKGIVDRTWQTIQDVIGRNIDAIKRVIGDIDWGALGRAIIDGIANGISNAAGRIADAAQDAAKSAYERAKSWLGIRSPSQKTERDIGVPFAEGIAEGAESGLRDITGRVDAGLAGLMGGLQAPQPAAAGAPLAGAQITVYVGGGGDEETGRAVGRGLLDELRSRGAI